MISRRISLALVLLSSTAVSLAAQEVSRPIMTGAACSPRVEGASGDLPTIIGGRNSEPRTLFAAREDVVLSPGSDRGLRVGQQYYVRRAIINRYENSARHSAVTAGWLTITAATENSAIGRIDFACDGIMAGDYLQPFAQPELPRDADRTNAAGELDFSKPARVLFGDHGRLTGGTGDFMLADIGQQQGAVPGARYAVYRNAYASVRHDMYQSLGMNRTPLAAVGEVILVSVGEHDSLFRVTDSRDAVSAGDLLIPHRQ